MPSTALRIATATSATLDPCDVEPEHADRERRRDDRLDRREQPRTRARSRATRSPRLIGSVISRSSVPDVRSRSIVTEVTRNITTSGKIPSSGGPTCWNCCSLLCEEQLQQPEQQQRHEHDQRDRARVVAQLGEQPARRGERWRARSRAAVGCARSGARTPRRGRRCRCRRAGPPAVVAASSRPSRSSRTSSQRAASSSTCVETSSVAPSSRSRSNSAHRSRRSSGSRPTVGSSSTSSSGRPSSAPASATRWRCPPDSRATGRCSLPRQADDLDHAAHVVVADAR